MQSIVIYHILPEGAAQEGAASVIFSQAAPVSADIIAAA